MWKNLLVSYQLRPFRACRMVDSVVKLDTVFSRKENGGNKVQKSDKKCIRAMENLWETLKLSPSGRHDNKKGFFLRKL